MNEDNTVVFVDTNVLVYAFDETAGTKHEVARSLFERLWSEGRGALSVQVLQEFYFVVTQEVPQPVEPPSAIDIVRDLTYWEVHAPVSEDVLGAIDLQQRHRLSFWDAMIVWSAQRLGCGELWTEDLTAGEEYDGLVVVNPLQP